MAVYKGLEIVFPKDDPELTGFFEGCRQHELRLQKCGGCGLLRYPPGYSCPWCASTEFSWQAVSGKGTIYSYEIVVQAVQRAFREWTPYPVVLVELDEQQGRPTEHEALRVLANLVDADFNAEQEENVAIGQRVVAVFQDLEEDGGDPFTLFQWRPSDEPPEGEVWQFVQR